MFNVLKAVCAIEPIMTNGTVINRKIRGSVNPTANALQVFTLASSGQSLIRIKIANAITKTGIAKPVTTSKQPQD